MSIPTSTQKLHSPTHQLRSLDPATLVTGNGGHLKCEVWLPVNSPAAPANLVPCARPSAINPAPNSHPVRPLAHPFSPQLLYDLIGSMEHKTAHNAAKIRVAQLDNLVRLQRQQDPQTCPQTRPPLRISGSAKPL
ncbi:hypothetical protein PtB15_8B607 [Puccinia triticina]|nr:hypothetical protein PtB15_8B607 [Puccinia triticina]